MFRSARQNAAHPCVAINGTATARSSVAGVPLKRDLIRLVAVRRARRSAASLQTRREGLRHIGRETVIQ